MKRLLFIIAIIMVLAIVGVYTFMEFSVPEISYVTDVKTITMKGNEMVLHRLYTSGINIDEFYESIENSLISASFTEDEIYAAALASGTPEFYPAFYFNTYQPDNKTSAFSFAGYICQEYAENQTAANFEIKNVHLELLTEGLTIENIKTTEKESGVKSMNAPVISEDKRSMAINLDNVSNYTFDLTGNGGKATFQYTYDIMTNSIFPVTVMTEQLLIVYANITVADTGVMVMEYISEPYSSLEDLG